MSEDKPTPTPDATSPDLPAAPDETTAAPASSSAAPTTAVPTVDGVPAGTAEWADGQAVVVDEEEVEVVLVPAAAEAGLAARLGAEAFGTFVLVFVGVAIALYSWASGIDTLAVALGFGVAVIAGAAAVGHISGGHFNPAVTLGAAIAGRLRWADVLPYWLAQLVGGIAAAATLFATASSEIAKFAAIIAAVQPDATQGSREFFASVSNGFAEHAPLAQFAERIVTQSSGAVESISVPLVVALLVEIVATAIFVGVILAVTDSRVKVRFAPVVIGLTLTVLILATAPFTNASINPARSTATAIFGADWPLSQLWLFWVAPLVGAAIAALVYTVFAKPNPLEDTSVEKVSVEV